MKDERGEFTSRLWLFLLKQGGRWHSRDVAVHLQESSLSVGQMLCGMYRNGNVRQFAVPGRSRSFTYGVTSDCKIPRTVRVRDVADCLMAMPDEEAA